MPIVVPSHEEQIMKEMSADMGIPYSQIRDIVIGGQSAFTAHVMRSNTFDGVRWPHFGVFSVKYKYLQNHKLIEGQLPMYQKLTRQRLQGRRMFKRPPDEPIHP